MPMLPPFALERFFARWEFVVRHVAGASDIEPVPMRELLALADDEMRGRWDDLRLGYTESAGHPLLRKEIASLYETISPDQSLVFSGAEEAIFILMHVLLQPGEHAVVTWPAYQSLHAVARSIGAHVDLLPLDPARGWALDLTQLQRLLRPTTRLIVVNFPHNPTGALPSREQFEALLDLARFAGCRVLSDEVYRGLEAEPGDQLPAACDRYEHAVSLGVMSKAYGLAGLRIGWIATRDAEVLRRAAQFKDYTTICASAPSELLSIMALRAREALLERARTIVATNLARLDEFFAAHSGQFAWQRPRGGSTAFPALMTGESIDDFTESLARNESVLLLPGTLFDHPGNHFRIGLGRTDLPDSLFRIQRFLKMRAGMGNRESGIGNST
jgi:aspartate/methionine/tyrosine aminotransferase